MKYLFLKHNIQFLNLSSILDVNNFGSYDIDEEKVSAPSEVQLYSFYPHAQDKYGCIQKVKDML